MVGKLLSLDLHDEGVVISIVHPGFMRTEMTAGVGFDKYWDDGGAVTPDEAAKTLVEWAEGLDMSKSGQYWAPRGPSEYFPFVHSRRASDWVLTLNRGYWDCRCDDGDESSYTVAAALVSCVLSLVQCCRLRSIKKPQSEKERNKPQRRLFRAPAHALFHRKFSLQFLSFQKTSRAICKQESRGSDSRIHSV